MLWFRSKHKQRIVDNKVKKLNEGLGNYVLSSSLAKNIDFIKMLFQDDDTVIIRPFRNERDSSLEFCIAYCDGLIDAGIINECIIKPLMLSEAVKSGKDSISTIMQNVVFVGEIKKAENIAEIVKAMTYGETVLFVDGEPEALILNSVGFKTRPITEPEGEKILSGPREGFTESIISNLAMVRRRVRTNDLKMRYLCIGEKTNTQACICYIDSVVNKNILEELYRRLSKIDIDGILDVNYITEMIKDNALSPFRTTGYTERPDVVVGKILEGRIAIFLDGTPSVLTVPYLFIENFQSNEDYYLNYYYTSFSRILRMLGFFLTTTVPAFYISIVAFHHEMLPTPLLINFASEQQSVPLPAALEAFILLIIFDILRETGIRMPSNIGQALSIVGALVIGQAAVEAKLVASPMIIVVALSGITNLLVPKLNAPIIFARMFLLVISSQFGLFGFALGGCIVFIHILNLHSMGISMVTPSGKLSYQEIKDIAMRAPWFQMIQRPDKIAADKIRMQTPEGDHHG